MASHSGEPSARHLTDLRESPDLTWRERVLAAILTTAGVARAAAFAWETRQSLAVYNLGVDTSTYDRIAGELVRTWSVSQIPSSQPPGFVIYLAGLYQVFGHNPAVVKIANCFWLAVAAVLVWRLGQRLIGERAGAIAAILCAWSPMFHAYAATVQYEILACTLLLGAQALVCEAERATTSGGRWMLLASAGFLAGWSILTREVLLVGLLPLVAYVLSQQPRDRVRAFEGLLIVSIAACVVGAWVSVQSVREGRFVPISDKGATNLAIGLNPNANGTYNIQQAGIGSPSGWAFVTHRPWRTWELAWRKAGYFWGVLGDGWNVPRSSAVYLGRATLNVFPFGVWIAWTRGAWLLCLAVIGALLLRRIPTRPGTGWLLTATILAVMAVHMLFISSHRFAVPVLPQIMLLVAIPVSTTVAWLKGRPGLLVVIVLLLTWMFVAQLGYWPGHYVLEAEELDGWSVRTVADHLAGNGRARFVAATSRARTVVSLPGDSLPRGWLVVVVSMRQPAVAPAGGPARDIAGLSFFVNGRRSCGAIVTTAHLTATGYARVPTRCDVAHDAVVKVELLAYPGAEFLVDRLDLYFGRADRRFIDPVESGLTVTRERRGSLPDRPAPSGVFASVASTKDSQHTHR